MLDHLIYQILSVNICIQTLSNNSNIQMRMSMDRSTNLDHVHNFLCQLIYNRVITNLVILFYI